MTHAVEVREVVESPTAVIAEATSWAEFPRLWPVLLDEVYAFIRSSGTAQTGHNVMLYRDDVPHVEVGVQVAGPFAASGRVTPSALPAGRIAATVHRGAYDGLGDAHAAVLAWCAANEVTVSRTRWEVYGDWTADPDELETEICYLLE